MKKMLFLIFPVLWSTKICMAQDSKHGKFKMGISYSPYSCYRLLNYRNGNSWLTGILNNEEIARYGFSAGLAVQYRINSVFRIQSGIQYSDLGQKTINLPLVWTTTNRNYPVSAYSIYHYDFIGIPLILEYCITKNKITWFFSAGFSGSVFLNKRTTVISSYEDGHQTKTSSGKEIGYAKFNLAALIGLGGSYELSKRFTCQLQPVFLRSLNSIVLDQNAKVYLYAIGMNIGLLYSFK